MARVCVFDSEMVRSLPPPGIESPEADQNELGEAMANIMHMIAPSIGVALDAVNMSESDRSPTHGGFLGIDDNMSADPARAIDPEGFVPDRFVSLNNEIPAAGSAGRSKPSSDNSARNDSMYEM